MSEDKDPSSIYSSLADHVSERLRSPFTGAFLISWIAINWKSLLILFFSAKDIERRIKSVALDFDRWSLLVWPLLLSIAVIAVFYIGSMLFAWLNQWYELTTQRIVKRFHPYNWMRKSESLAEKEKLLARIRRAEDLAVDNRKEIADATELVNSANAERAEAIAELGRAKESIHRLEAQIAGLSESRDSAMSSLSLLKGSVEALTKRNNVLDAAIQSSQTPLLTALSGANAADKVISRAHRVPGPISTLGAEASSGLAKLAGIDSTEHFAFSTEHFAVLTGAVDSTRSGLHQVSEALAKLTDPGAS